VDVGDSTAAEAGVLAPLLASAPCFQHRNRLAAKLETLGSKAAARVELTA
jgi:hypothetical protein